MFLRVAYAGDRHWVCFVTTLMSACLVMPILFQATMSTAGLIAEAAIVSNCEAPAVREGHNATLTCHFNNDLRNTKQGVKVVQYNSQTFEKTVLSCLWHFDKANCIENYGFTFNGEISSELRLYIPRVRKEHTGTYACIVFASEPETQDTCFLKVIADPSDIETFSDGCRGNVQGCSRDEFPQLLPVVIAACILVSVVIILTILVIIIIYRRNSSCHPVQSKDIQISPLIS